MDGDKDREQQGMLDYLQWDAVDTAVIKDRNEEFVRAMASSLPGSLPTSYTQSRLGRVERGKRDMVG